MKIISIVKNVLFTIECIRIIILAIILIGHGHQNGFSVEIVFISPAVLYLLMALFIMLDTGRYRAYIPLFAAGKCLSIFILLGWFIITGQVTIMESIVLSADLITFVLIIPVMRDSGKIKETQKIYISEDK